MFDKKEVKIEHTCAVELMYTRETRVQIIFISHLERTSFPKCTCTKSTGVLQLDLFQEFGSFVKHLP